MSGSVSIRAMVGRHHNSMKMNLRKNSAEPLNYESIFSGQGHCVDVTVRNVCNQERRSTIVEIYSVTFVIG